MSAFVLTGDRRGWSLPVAENLRAKPIPDITPAEAGWHQCRLYQRHSNGGFDLAGWVDGAEAFGLLVAGEA